MRVCIDAGHGLGNKTAGVFDSGAVGGGIREADVALAYALGLRAALTALGVSVYLTRDSNTVPCPLNARAGLAKAAGCTAFVSVHLNAYDGKATGTEVLYRSEAKDKPLAQALQRAIVDAVKLKDRGVKARPELSVLKFAAGPAVLIELGFIDNAKDRELLRDGAVKSVLTAAIARTIRDVLIPSQAKPGPFAPTPRIITVSGKVSHFGGPSDGPSEGNARANWKTEGLALIEPKHLADPRLAALFLPAKPGLPGLARRLNPEALYVAYRWDYSQTPKDYLRSITVPVRNPATGLQLQAHPVDWGPRESTGKTFDLSPALERRLGLVTGAIAEMDIPLPR